MVDSLHKSLVSVWMVTYNHEAYIEQAIESVMMQTTNFDFHLYIGEDCSTDNTGEICERLKTKYPKQITLVRNKKNLGANNNALNIYNLCFNSDAKYMAMLEGDDYWTDPLKLQKQVDFLEANLDYNMCFHSVKVFNESKKILEGDVITKPVPETTTIKELSKGNYIHTPSVLLRNNFTLPKWFVNVPVGDWVLYMIAVKDKKIKKIEETMAVYRFHEKGLWTSKDKRKQMLMSLDNFKYVYNNLNLNAIANDNLKIKILFLERELSKGNNEHKSNFIRRLLNVFLQK